MAKKKAVKTNALRLLDRDHVSYRVEEYDYDEEHLSGEHIIDQVSLNGEDIYKTLVLQSDDDRSYLVCCIPMGYFPTKYKKENTCQRCFLFWSRVRESNPTKILAYQQLFGFVADFVAESILKC